MTRKLSEEKKAIIGNLIEAYDIKTTKDIQEALKDLLGGTLEEMLETEMTEELGYERYDQTEEGKTNYRNGHKGKRVKTTMGELEIEVPQDRNSEFAPKIVPKHKRDRTKNHQYVRTRTYDARDKRANRRHLWI